ncbi:MAG: hypothetical protein FJ224_05780, partial [Lentisphaerae bacterium]|nr:hypothetical protein [Lentisphaerota bacterium]
MGSISQRTAYLALVAAIVALLGTSVILGVVFFQSLPETTDDRSAAETKQPAGNGETGAGAGSDQGRQAGASGRARKFALHLPGVPPTGPTAPFDRSKLHGKLSPEDLEMALQAGFPPDFKEDCTDCGLPFNFSAPGAGFNVYPSPGEMVLCLQRPDFDPALSGMHVENDYVDCETLGSEVCLTMRFSGISPGAQTASATVPPAHYMEGNDPQRWFSDLPPYLRTQSSGIYPGVDFSFYSDQNRFEFVFTLAPGADPSDISVSYLGANSLTTQPDSSLEVGFPGGKLVQRSPAVYEIIEGTPYPYQGRHEIEQDQAKIKVVRPQHDGPRPRGIDQLGYVGGTGDDSAYAVAVDNRGYGYVVGETTSPGFGRVAPSTPGPARRIFVSRYRLADSDPVYTTFLSGSVEDRALGIAADRDGNAYICGETVSPDFPASLPAPGSSPSKSWDAFITKLDPSGRSIQFTYRIPGSGDDRAYAIALDRTGNIYAAGETRSADFPFTSVLRKNHRLGGWDGFVVKLDPSGTFLHYAVCMGGSGDDTIFGLGIGPD